jgi:hypothetical protein
MKIIKASSIACLSVASEETKHDTRPKSKHTRKTFGKWLQTESRIAGLKIWIGFVKFVLGLGAIVGLTIYVGNRFPEALRYLPPVVAGICSLAGIAIGIDKY